MPTPQEVLRFWFEETPAAAWFRPGPERDRTVRERFGPLTDQALAGGLAAWGERADDALALLLVLDQFPRQIWRDQARAFAGDGCHFFDAIDGANGFLNLLTNSAFHFFRTCAGVGHRYQNHFKIKLRKLFTAQGKCRHYTHKQQAHHQRIHRGRLTNRPGD